jgi:Leucine-rich repeat (LRR) protein
MKVILGPRGRHYVARASIFLITAALVWAMMGCTPEPFPQCELTIDSTAGGSVADPGEGTFVYEEGSTVYLIAVAEEGYRFASWTGDVDDIANIGDAITSIIVSDNYSITANFEVIPEYHLTISSTTGGSVTEPGEGTFTYNASTKVGLVAHEDVGYGFIWWTGDVKTIPDVYADSTSITMNDNYSITANFEEEEAVALADPNLEAAIRAATHISNRPIYPSDLKRLTSLHAEQRNVSNLTGLEYCTGLTRLYLYDNQIDDISPVANLTSLRGLSLGGNQIRDISPLAKPTNLRELSLSGNQIRDISPLANLTNLTDLNFDFNQIRDISPLANLTGLTNLSLSGNQITDISALANLTSLRELSLSGNQIGDISPVGNLTSVRELSLSGNQISDISPLADLTSVRELSLSGNQISDISPLAKLTELDQLWLSYNQISDILPLVNNAGLSQGDEVYLSSNPLSPSSISTYIPQLEARGVIVEYYSSGS